MSFEWYRLLKQPLKVKKVSGPVSESFFALCIFFSKFASRFSAKPYEQVPCGYFSVVERLRAKLGVNPWPRKVGNVGPERQPGTWRYSRYKIEDAAVGVGCFRL